MCRACIVWQYSCMIKKNMFSSHIRKWIHRRNVTKNCFIFVFHACPEFWISINFYFFMRNIYYMICISDFKHIWIVFITIRIESGKWFKMNNLENEKKKNKTNRVIRILFYVDRRIDLNTFDGCLSFFYSVPCVLNSIRFRLSIDRLTFVM